MRIHDRANQLLNESAFKVLARARELEAEGRDVIHLEIGQPDFPTPGPICDAAVEALRAGHTGYGPTPGLPELREAIAESSGKLRGLSFDPSRVIVTPGGKPVLYYAINSLAGPGDEVIIPDPSFPMYPSIVAHSGATAVPLRLHESRDFRFDVAEFRRLLSPRTRLIVLNSPQNPTGGILEREDLEAIAADAIERDIAVLSDEIYSRILYDEKFESIASVPGMTDRTIILDGFSKTYSMTGWRMGYAIVPPSLTDTFERYNVNIVSCVSTFSQFGATRALTMDQAPVDAMVKEFSARRSLLVEGLNALPRLSCIDPRGAFYAFANITQTGLSSEDFARRLLDEAGVAALSGSSFGPGGEGFLRLSYANSRENLERALERMGNFLSSLKNHSGPA